MIAWLSVACSAATVAQKLSETYRRVKSSVVVVHVVPAGVSVTGRSGESADEDIGSGVLISAEGKVVTAAHVVEDADQVMVELINDQKIRARVVAVSLMTDVAVLQLDKAPRGVVAARLGDSDRVEVGDDIFVVGAPYGLSYTLTAGRVSARRRERSTFGLLSPTEFLQTDAAINSGNSGGPVFNMTGEVVGIVSSSVSESGGSEGLGFAATSNAVRSLLLGQGTFWSGLEGMLIRDDMARAFNLPQASGLLVMRIAKDSPAERLGLKGGQVDALIDDQEVRLGGDIILEINGTQINGDPQQYEQISVGGGGREARLTCKVLRGGKVMELSTRPTPATLVRGNRR